MDNGWNGTKRECLSENVTALCPRIISGTALVVPHLPRLKDRNSNPQVRGASPLEGIENAV